MLPKILTLDHLRALYAARPGAIFEMMDEVVARARSARDKAIFISLIAEQELRQKAEQLLAKAPDPSVLPLAVCGQRKTSGKRCIVSSSLFCCSIRARKYPSSPVEGRLQANRI